jgi:alkanesulfonate monooxygenase SsuD/methylene tetrahydromethanopterin reductase-like flavin-dependent oxidoreductase (luciferase family)
VWFSEHHFRPVWSHNSAPDLTLAAVRQRTSRIRLGIGVVLAPIHHPLHVAARMATLDILSHGRVDVGLGRTGYPYQLIRIDLRDTRGMWQEFADVPLRIWTGGSPPTMEHFKSPERSCPSLCSARIRRCGRRAAATRQRA